MHCSENRFCSQLPPELRCRLCEACVKATFAAGSSVAMDFYKHFLPIEGLCCTCHHHARFAFRPGDFVITPHADSSRDISVMDVSFADDQMGDAKLRFITCTTVAFFKKRDIDELLRDEAFLRVSYANLKDLYAHLTAYLIGVNSSSAYDSVAYVLRWCAHNDIGQLTHEQISVLTGISRTTVTSIIHQIALAEPNFPAPAHS